MSDAITEICHHTWLNDLKYKGEIYSLCLCVWHIQQGQKGLKNEPNLALLWRITVGLLLSINWDHDESKRRVLFTDEKHLFSSTEVEGNVTTRG